MKKKNYKYLLYFIAATITATVAIQVYWNIQNYNTNKARLINEVQISLDNSVEAYYSELAKPDIFAFAAEKHATSAAVIRPEMIDFMGIINVDQLDYTAKKNSKPNTIESLSSFSQIIDTTNQAIFSKSALDGITIIRNENEIDSTASISNLVNRLTISIARDSINFVKLDSILQKELVRKKLKINYDLEHLKNDSIFEKFEVNNSNTKPLLTESKSTYLPLGHTLQLRYSNPTLSILRRSLTGILLSFLLSICIIACLFYLLHIITKQKELAEIKNDLISNITHEFKTPIATVFTAIEGIKNFNTANDLKKTKTYLELSNQQLTKLNQMVEKLLETATLDSNKLLLKKEKTDLVILLQKIAEKYHLLTNQKTIEFKSNKPSISSNVDVFHFENALANLLDNASKYGGEIIQVQLNVILDVIEITVTDNGGGIDKNHRDKIFDKFYRIPTGNRHDVKGFGIGLYYTQKIIEKHGGDIMVMPSNKNTIFKITL